MGQRTGTAESIIEPLALLKLLAHDLRWALLQRLTMSDYRVNELVAQVGQPGNLVSYHLKQLREGEIVTTRRSDADGRDIYYSLDVDHLRGMIQRVSDHLRPKSVESVSATTSHDHASDAAIRVLFVCTHNSARSQMAEGLTRHLGGGSVQVYSAGNKPTTIHPESIRTLDALGVDIRGQQVNHISEYTMMPFDYVITVCDNAREVCPTFKGEGAENAVQYHWGFTDPAAVADPDERAAAFWHTARRLHARIEHLLETITGAGS